MTTYANVARQSASLTPASAEEWCASREVSIPEAIRIFVAARGDVDAAHALWANEDWWTDENHAANATA